MLSQLTKTIKLALKSTEHERAILRARSAVQRFPVVEWRQRLEDFQKRSINASRGIASEHAWGYDLVGQGAPLGGRTGFYAHEMGSTTSLAGGEMPPGNRPMSGAPHLDGQFDNNQLSANGPAYHDRFKQSQRNQNRQSAESFYDEDPNAEPLYYGDKRRSKKFFAGGQDDDASSRGSSDHGESTAAASMRSGAGAGGAPYDSFLAAANKQFSKTSGNRNAPDPLFDSRQSVDANFMPSRPFSIHSRVSSFDSISSIVEDKGASSPLNKAMDSVS
jgi:alpha-1,3-glucan synthase